MPYIEKEIYMLRLLADEILKLYKEGPIGYKYIYMYIHIHDSYLSHFSWVADNLQGMSL